jgi:hypothetical protein
MEEKLFSKAHWEKRIILEMAVGQIKRLKKGKNAQVMKDGQIYIIKPANPLLTLKYGTRKVNQKLAIELLKKIAEGGQA